MNCSKVKKEIVKWLKEYNEKAGTKGFVVGVSGGVDSAVVSTLCAMTKLPTTVVMLPIHQPEEQLELAELHCQDLGYHYFPVAQAYIDLTHTFDVLVKAIGTKDELSLANIRSRLRMTALYGIANEEGKLVVGTGNKIEDYGVGFFTKYGDGGVDLSPIGDLTKTEVYQLAKHLKIIDGIQKAKPTDGLWDDGRSDEDQLGATYAELEWAMNICEKMDIYSLKSFEKRKENFQYSNISLTEKDERIIKIYLSRHLANRHKMEMPPICLLDK